MNEISSRMRQPSVRTSIIIRKSDLIEWWYVVLFIIFFPSFVLRAVDIPYWGYFCYVTILINDIYIVYTRRKITSPTVWSAVLYGYFLMVTLIVNAYEIFNCLLRTFLAVSFVMTVEYMFEKYKEKRTINFLMRTMEVFNYLNLLSMILYPAGMYKVVTSGIYEKIVKVEYGAVRTSQRVLWLLGHQTMMARFTLPSICIALLVINMNGGKIKGNFRSIALIAVCIVETVIANSVGNYLVLFVFLSFMMLFHFRGRIKSWMVYPWIALTYAFFFISSGELNIFTLFSSLVNRRVRLSTRVMIWLNTLNAWLEKPIFGWGYINENSTYIRQLLSLGNPHSTYLWALFEGGIIGLVLLVIFIQRFSKQLRNCWNSKNARIIYAAFISILIAMVDDDYIFRFPQILIIFILVYHIPSFVKHDL